VDDLADILPPALGVQAIVSNGPQKDIGPVREGSTASREKMEGQIIEPVDA
jgi:hypothetical protein